MADIRRRMVALLPRLRAFARALARNPDTADDLVQATCEKALKRADSWIEGTRLDSWMFRIMQNHWIDQKRGTRPELPLDDPDTAANIVGMDGQRVADSRLALADTRTLIEQLPEEQRAVLVLVCVNDVSYAEAADILQIPPGTVMSRLARARSALAARLEGNDSPKAAGAAT